LHNEGCAENIAADAAHENIALASNIEKLLHPNKDKKEKLMLEQRFDDIIGMVDTSKADVMHSVIQQLFDFKQNI
jgi:hypothetical protein